MGAYMCFRVLIASWTKGGVGDSDSLAALSEHPARNPQE